MAPTLAALNAGITVGVVWLVLAVTVGIICLVKGHWVMFLIGLFIPLFWIIGAIIPRRHSY